MHARQLAELAGWVAIHSAELLLGEQAQSMMVAKTYWTASKCRIQRWITALKMFETDLRQPDRPHDPWPALEIVVQEILVSEMLTRIWSAAIVTHHGYQTGDELHGLAHGIHISHLETKNRAFRSLLGGRGDNEEAFDRLNLLRRRVERWTDLFLGQLPQPGMAATFGFQSNRVKDFATEQRHFRGGAFSKRQQVLLASMSADLYKCTNRFPANPALNWDVACGILACFPADRFDSNELPKSARMLWVEKSSREAQFLFDQLLALEEEWNQTPDQES